MTDSLLHCSCGGKFGVIDSRPHMIGGFETILRKRKCPTCGTRKATLELDRALAAEVLADD